MQVDEAETMRKALQEIKELSGFLCGARAIASRALWLAEQALSACQPPAITQV